MIMPASRRGLRSVDQYARRCDSWAPLHCVCEYGSSLVQSQRSRHGLLLLQTTGRIQVWNNGNGIPVEMHKKEGVYVPELIFGHLLTSSNYDDTEKKVRFQQCKKTFASCARMDTLSQLMLTQMLLEPSPVMCVRQELLLVSSALLAATSPALPSSSASLQYQTDEHMCR